MTKPLIPRSDEFYVGYLPEAPPATASFIKKVVIALGVVILLIALTLIFHQRPFSTANFEYGVTSQLKGYVFTTPVPHLVVPLGKDVAGNAQSRQVLLVAAGKHGADELLRAVADHQGTSLDGQYVSISGYLLYGDGKSLLQVNAVDDVVVQSGHARMSEAPKIANLAHVAISGEVVDPKCYFGVMKPGEGKPHRSCAIRCISGGIPPVFKSEMSEYFLLTGENLEPVNREVLGFVGDAVRLEGEMVEMDGWKILKIKKEKLQALSASRAAVRELMAKEENMSFCGMNE